jgi:hypothetical protein
MPAAWKGKFTKPHLGPTREHQAALDKVLGQFVRGETWPNQAWGHSRHNSPADKYFTCETCGTYECHYTSNGLRKRS